MSILIKRPYTLVSILLYLFTAFSVAGNVEKGIKLYEKKEFQEAFQIIKVEAEKGNAEAQFYLGKMLNRGEGTKRNLQEAVYWYQKGASQGNPKAMYNLAYLYAYGKELKKTLKKLLSYIHKQQKKGCLWLNTICL